MEVLPILKKTRCPNMLDYAVCVMLSHWAPVSYLVRAQELLAPGKLET